jgi:hypothetical protein
MNDRDEHVLEVATDRFERRLSEENGKLRVEMAQGFGQVRADIIDRNHEMLKWALVFWTTLIAAVAALLALFR